MKDSADPLRGWDFAEVLKTPSGPARNDIYCKLFYYLRELFSSFHRRLSSLNTSFQLFHLDAQDLPDYLETGTFARIEVHMHHTLRGGVANNPIPGRQYF